MWSAEMVLACALTLLHRSADSLPPIMFVDVRPGYVSADAEAYVLEGDRRIHLFTTTAAFVRARSATHRCGDLQALRKIASVLVHEEWHVRHGADESGAYAAQLTALASLDARPGNPLYAAVQRSWRAALRRQR